jgi:hypothetical protein
MGLRPEGGDVEGDVARKARRRQDVDRKAAEVMPDFVAPDGCPCPGNKKMRYILVALKREKAQRPYSSIR